jgi:hypothetical protein
MADMNEDIMTRRYEFFSWPGFIVGAVSISAILLAQSLISFPQVWMEHAFAYPFYLLSSAFAVGIASGGVLIYLFPPEQDIIGVAGLGSDDASQHLALGLVLLALLQPMLSGFVLFFDYFGNDQLIPIWILLAFVAPSAGLTAAMFERTNSIADDLRVYFSQNDRLDMARLDWLHGLGPRTAAYRMGMLENAAKKVSGIRVHGHEIVKEPDRYAINQ